MEWNEPCLVRYDFRFGAKRRPAIARLGYPRPDQKHAREWVCAFQIQGLKDSRIRLARGEDGLQALTIASTVIRTSLNRLKTIDPAVLRHEFVFPRYLPFCYGLEFHRKLCKIVDAEIKKKDKQLSKRVRPRRDRPGLS